MSGYIKEYFGMPLHDDEMVTDEKTLKAWAVKKCPFTGQTCTKKRHDGSVAGVCSVHMSSEQIPVIICPNRLYGENWKLLHTVASDAFNIEIGSFALVAGEPAACEYAKEHPDITTIAVFGHGWGHELPLPTATKSIKAYCSIDWILVRLDEGGEPVEFCAAEVQTIDTTGSHANASALLDTTHTSTRDTVGLNWANVRKRIFQQIVYKGQVLERDRKCSKGLYYIVPRPVFENNFKSLGGTDNLPSFPQRPGTITFFVYDYDPETTFIEGETRPMAHVQSYTTGIHKLQEAFSNYLPTESDLFYKAIRKGLGLREAEERQPSA